MRIKHIALVSSTTESAEPTVEWDDTYTKISLRNSPPLELNKIPSLYQGLLSQAHQLIQCLTQHHSIDFPAWAPLQLLADDKSNASAGYSVIGDDVLELWPLRKRNLEAFIADPRNTASVFATDGQPTKWEAHIPAMEAFMVSAHKLNEIFLILFHLGGGPPSRATELFTLTYRNGPGAKRTLFAPGGELHWTLMYSKVKFLYFEVASIH